MAPGRWTAPGTSPLPGPDASIGRDEMGNVITKMKWVASYTEGDEHGSVTQEKVIVIRP
jgi:hypothetical protein